jgi:hypothetical protein
MQENSADYLAMIQFFAVATGIESFIMHAFAYFAQIAAKEGFRPGYAAAHAINHGRCNLHIIQLTPLFGGLLSQLIVIVNSGYTGVAFFAIQPATGD